ncbi:MAG: hypothetical protein HC908_10575 [Calothrix sp. SM1_7_51]|nr:hypothetical protein [Calothrix sp. SM1_7_51]
MLKRLLKWLKQVLQSLFGTKPARSIPRGDVQKAPAPPLTDTDLEFLFTELLEGVHQARGEVWAQKWLHNLEARVTTERWIEWLQRFGEKLLASPSPNNELASRLVQLGELEVGQISDVSYDIGMQVLRRNQPEPIWEYDGPDTQRNNDLPANGLPNQPQHSEADSNENFPPPGDFQTVSLDELLGMMQQDGQLRQLIAQQVGVESDDPSVIVQALVDQYLAASQSAGDEQQL